MVLKMSTGGMLIGDPAYQPFAAKPESDPRVATLRSRGKDILVDIQITTPVFHFFTSEQINYWNDHDPALRLETAVEIGNKQVEHVQLVQSSLGDVPHKLVAAVESHGDKRLLRVKAIFAQPSLVQLQSMVATGVTGTFRILTSDSSDVPVIIRQTVNDHLDLPVEIRAPVTSR
jgi:hypothetical protein